MSQIKVKQIVGLQNTINSITGRDNIIETFTTNQTNGDTGITLTYAAFETDAIMVFVNGHKVQEGFSWKYNGSAVSTATLEAGSELVWDQTTAGYALESDDEIQIQYETPAGGPSGAGSQPGSTYNDTAVNASIDSLELSLASANTLSASVDSLELAVDQTDLEASIDSLENSTSSTTMGGTMTSSIIPDTNAQYDLGSAEYKIRHLFLSDSSLYFGDQVISMQNNKLQLPALTLNPGTDDEFEISSKSQMGKLAFDEEEARMIKKYDILFKYACSSVWIKKTPGAEENFVGSGQWVSLQQNAQGTPTDGAEGWFLTCAHNVMQLDGNNQHQIFDQVWINYLENWYRVDPSWIFYDAVADVCLIKTGITIQANHMLKISSVEPLTGQTVWICGFPGGYDTDSMTKGIIRDAHFNINDSGQAVDSLFLNAPAIGGNSGSAILNNEGDIVGIYTFGYTDKETFGGGANRGVVYHVTEKLKVQAQPNARFVDKNYLGVDWARTSPIVLDQSYYPLTDGVGGPVLYATPQAKGVRITNMHANSPLQGVVNVGDIILSASVAGNQYDFGYADGQYTLGVLIYEALGAPVDITYIDQVNRARLTKTFTPVAYSQVPEEHDFYLIGGTSFKILEERVD